MISRFREEHPYRFGLAVALGTFGLYFCWVWPGAFFEQADGLYAGWRTIWGDWSAHLAYAQVFATRSPGDWFDPHPLLAGHSFDYPFASAALSGLLMRTGLGPVTAFVVPSLLLSLVLVAALYTFYYRQLGTPGRSLLASALFFASGGLGFLAFAADLGRKPSLATLLAPPREYTFLPGHGIEWINVVSSELLPQRAFLLALPLALGLLTLLWRWRETGFRDVSAGRLLGAGLLASALVCMHLHSFAAVAFLCAGMFVTDLRHARQWLSFAVAAGIPSTILFANLYGLGARGLAFEPGWVAAGRDFGVGQVLWLNWGVFLPLAAVSLLRLPEDRNPLVFGGVALFVACFLLRFQPNMWDNTKLLTWATLLLCVPVARYLAHLWSKPGALSRQVAVALLVFATSAGLLDLWHVSGGGDRVAWRMWSRDDLELAAAFQEISDPTALVLTAERSHHWVPSLSGRPILLGFPGWIWSYGLDGSGIQRDIGIMLAGGAPAEALLDEYGVDFVVIGDEERRRYEARESWFIRNHRLVLERGATRIFAVEGRTS